MNKTKTTPACPECGAATERHYIRFPITLHGPAGAIETVQRLPVRRCVVCQTRFPDETTMREIHRSSAEIISRKMLPLKLSAARQLAATNRVYLWSAAALAGISAIHMPLPWWPICRAACFTILFWIDWRAGRESRAIEKEMAASSS